MSMSKAVPEDLKNQEWEKGNWRKCPPIPYVPVVDEVQEAIAKGKEYSYKTSLKDTLLEKKVALEAKAMTAEGFFSLYANLLSKDT